MELDEIDKKQLIPENELNSMQEELMEEKFNIVRCNNCQNKFEFQPGKFEKMPGMNDEQAKCFAENRFKCSKCGTEQCRKCKKEKEFHRGMTCEQFQQKKKSMYVLTPGVVFKNFWRVDGAGTAMKSLKEGHSMRAIRLWTSATGLSVLHIQEMPQKSYCHVDTRIVG
jgi:hypothetical protein